MRIGPDMSSSEVEGAMPREAPRPLFKESVREAEGEGEDILELMLGELVWGGRIRWFKLSFKSCIKRIGSDDMIYRGVI